MELYLSYFYRRCHVPLSTYMISKNGTEIQSCRQFLHVFSLALYERLQCWLNWDIIEILRDRFITSEKSWFDFAPIIELFLDWWKKNSKLECENCATIPTTSKVVRNIRISNFLDMTKIADFYNKYFLLLNSFTPTLPNYLPN